MVTIKKYQNLFFFLLILFMSYTLLGEFFYLYQVNKLIWQTTIIQILYLSWSGTGAIFLVIFGISAVIWLGVYKLYSFQTFAVLEKVGWTKKLSIILYNFHIHNHNYNHFTPTVQVAVWAIMFFCVWGLAITVALIHGFTHHILSKFRLKQIQIFFILTFLALLGLQIGTIFLMKLQNL
uniref:Uncharacterized protein n=1 Tax=Gloeothece verrucosa (strain PCC 7822) TaxID=497965 RepID=E0UD51_GLOV7|nr:hypothetical protein Cyan7822_0917 [Gloeothece verrucosa PCC 7822]